MSYVRPISSGVIATDDSDLDFIPVSLNFSTTGSYGSNSTFWVMQNFNNSAPWSTPGSAVTGGVGAPEETEAQPWILVSPTPADNSAFNYTGYTQERGTTSKYHARRFNQEGTQWVEMGTTNFQTTGGSVSEKVPTMPALGSVVETVNGSNTIHTVNLLNNPAADGITTVYYRQTTTQTFFDSDDSLWRDTDNDGNPPSGWTTNAAFTFSTPASEVVYYYWALGWTAGNPGPDGAALSGFLQKRVGGEDFGLQINTPNNSYVLNSATGIATNNQTRHLAVIHTDSVTGSEKEVSASHYQEGDTIWARPAPAPATTGSGYVLTRAFSGYAQPPLARPQFLDSTAYILQRASNEIVVGSPNISASQLNGSEFGLQVKNKLGTVIFDSRKFNKGVEIKQSTPPNVLVGGEYDTSDSYYISNNLVYTAASLTQFQNTYVSTQGGAFSPFQAFNTGNFRIIELNGFYFDQPTLKIYFHSRIRLPNVFLGGGLSIIARTVAIRNLTDILIGELIA